MKKTFLFISFLMLFTFARSQNTNNRFNLVFYNVENFFDTINDTNTLDDEFTPSGVRKWNGYKYHRKLKNTYKVLSSVSGWEIPDMIVLAEIENKTILNHLIFKTPLYKQAYRIIHKDSRDRRGIDLAILYRKDRFHPIFDSCIQLNFPDDSNYYSRDLLFTSGLIPNGDTLHVLAVHYPSKYGGTAISNPKRIFASKTVLSFLKNRGLSSSDLIIIVGDFNCSYEEKPYQILLEDSIHFQKAKKINQQYGGSYKHKGHWQTIDHALLSEGLTHKQVSVRYYSPNFILEEDKKYSGKKPLRTWTGYKYLGGYSDHLPLIIEIEL